MKRQDPIDPRIDRLVGALYGELSDAERREFEAALESDAALRAEWEELSGTRSLLGSWELDERVPSFVVVDPTPARRDGRATGFWARLSERFGGALSFGGWAVAGAAAVVMLLAVKGVQFERTSTGFAFNFGRPAAVQPAGGVSPAIRDAESIFRPDGGESGNGRSIQLASDGDDSGYLTRDEFDQYSAAMLRMMSAYLSDYRSRRDQEIGAALRTLYGQLNAQQSSQYEDLLGRIDSTRPFEEPALTPTNIGWSRVDSLGSTRQRPDGIEVKRNE